MHLDQVKAIWLAQRDTLFELVRYRLIQYIDNGSVYFEISLFPLREPLKISTPPPRITYTELNTESFRAALIGVMGSGDA